MHSKVFDKISEKLKNIQTNDLQSIMNNVTKKYQSLQPEQKKETLNIDEPAVDTKSSDELFFECATAPPKPERTRKQNGKGKYERQRSGSLGTTKIEENRVSRDSLSTWPDKDALLQSKQYDHLKVPSKRLSFYEDAEENMSETNDFRYQSDLADERDYPAPLVPPPNCNENIDPLSKSPNKSQSDFSSFVQKKSIAQGMMDLALVSANTNQLRYVIDMDGHHPYYLTSLVLITTSLVLQVVVGLAMLYSNRFNIRKKQEMKSADRVNNFSIIGVFMITLINVFISTFNGSNSHPKTPEVVPTNSSCPPCVSASTSMPDADPVIDY